MSPFAWVSVFFLLLMTVCVLVLLIIPGHGQGSVGHDQLVPKIRSPSHVRVSDEVGHAQGSAVVHNEAIKICDSTLRNRTWSREWGEQFTYSMKWPIEIYDESIKGCRKTTDDDDVWLLGPRIDQRIQIRWSDAMRDTHEFDPREQKFVCKAGEIRVDYLGHKTEPEYDLNEYFVDPGKPCRPSPAAKLSEAPWGYAKPIVRYPDSYPPMLVGEKLFERELDSWPYIDKDGRTRFQHLIFDTAAKTARIETYASPSGENILPLGFFGNDVPTEGPLKLRGFTAGVPTDRKKYVWYILASGSFTLPRFTENLAEHARYLERSEPLNVPKNGIIDLGKSDTYDVPTPFIEGEVAVGETMVLSARGIKFKGFGDDTVVEENSFRLLRIEVIATARFTRSSLRQDKPAWAQDVTVTCNVWWETLHFNQDAPTTSLVLWKK